MEQLSTVQVLEKQEPVEDPFQDENITNNIKQEATQSVIQSEDEDVPKLSDDIDSEHGLHLYALINNTKGKTHSKSRRFVD